MGRTARSLAATAVALVSVVAMAPAASAAPADVPVSPCAGQPWMDRSKSPDERATLVLAQMTLDEKMQEMHTISDATHSRLVPGIARLCVPAIQMNNGPAGVSSGEPVQFPATALPAPIGQAATFDPSTAWWYGLVEGR